MTIPPPSSSQQQSNPLIPAAAGHARRRSRHCARSTASSSLSLSLSSSLDHVKQPFMSTVEDAIHNLMESCGYSRSRAIAALLHDIRRDVPTPTDDEVFRVMERCGLGIEDATRALIVSSAIQRSVKENNVSVADAVHELTEKLSLTNPQSLTECGDFSDSDERPRSPDRRIEAVSAFERPASSSRKHQISPGNNKKGKVASKTKTKTQSKASTGAPPKSASRKRFMEESNQGDKMVIKRERTDPTLCDDDVDAQVAIKCKEDGAGSVLTDAAATSTKEIRPTPPPPLVAARAKRSAAHRMEESNASSQASALKRPRPSDA